MSRNDTRGGGISFTGSLALLFITLKLTGTIHWSWLWVLSPIWIPIGLVFSILIFIGLMALVTTLRSNTRL